MKDDTLTVQKPSFLLTLSILPILFTLSCKKEGPQFHELEDGIEFRRVVLGEGRKRTDFGEGVGVRYRIGSMEDPERCFTSDSVYFLLDRPDGVWTTMLSSMSLGDSSIFRLRKELLLQGKVELSREEFPDTMERARVEIKLLDRREPTELMEWKIEQEGEEVLKQDRWEEWKKIRDLVEELSDSNEARFLEGIYAIPVERGTGPKVRAGREIAVHYKGYLPDSTVFDNSYQREEPLRFRFGAPKQVIRGMGIGLKYMREGGKAKLIVPSYLAFGKKGGETGILPPHTFVYYEVEVLEVKP